MEGQILGNRYEIIEKIGGGGMARVYKARCKLLNRFVAVKILRKDFSNDDEFIRRFRIEAQAAASLSHPNIVSIYDVGMEEDTHFIVMEYVDGITLKDYINKKGQLEWKETVNIGRQMCSAIDHAHKNGIVHRDIKPHNILYNSEGIVKVTDFGIARAASFSSITMVGTTIGSVHYFSPEQARGGYTDEKSDIYSMGVVLYEMITGKLPFDGDSPVSIALKHVQNEPEEPIKINKETTTGLNSIILNALKKDQTIRYQTAAEFLNDLNLSLKDPDENYLRIESDTDSPTMRLPVVGDKLPDDGGRKMSQKQPQKSEKQKKRNRFFLLFATFSAILIIPLFAFLGVNVIVPAIFGQEAEEFVFLDYTGSFFVQTKDRLEEKGIEVGEVRRFDEEFPRNTIISQSRPSGQRIKLSRYRTYIEFEVSDGPERIKLPDIRNLDYRAAETQLSDLGLPIEREEVHHNTVANRLVISSEPPHEAMVSPTTKVTIFVSKGPEQKFTMVPYMIGKTRTEALGLIEGARLSLGKVSPENSTNINDIVAQQSPDPNATVEEGTAVTLIFDLPENVLNTDPVQRHTLVLRRPELYGEEIRVTVEIVREGNSVGDVLLDEMRRKSEFPLTITLPVPANSNLKTRIYIDGGLHKEI
jgi:eukaryotic-like serine/threonine-protein kinase